MTHRAPARSATISAGAATGVPLKNATCSRPLRRATTHSLERRPLWPGLTRPSMAGFQVSTEAVPTYRASVGATLHHSRRNVGRSL